MPAKNFDPALRLLCEAETDPGGCALLLFAGDGSLAKAFAPKFADVVCHNAFEPLHAACVRAKMEAGLDNVHCLLGDLPAAERIASAAHDSGRAGEAKDGEGADEEVFDAVFPAERFDCIAFRLARGTAQVNASLIEAFKLLRVGGTLLVAGANQEGIKSFAKRAEAHFGNAELLSLKSSCRLLRFRKESARPGEPVEDPRYFHPVALTLENLHGDIDYVSKPGIFAYRATDPGTALLARHMPDCAGKRVLDLGCGSGVLSLAALRSGAAEVLAVDANAIAVACTRRNFQRGGTGAKARALCADMGANVGAGADAQGFDIILSNPPFHEGADTDYSLPARVLDALMLHLRSGGEAFIVANQFLDYAAQGRKRFAGVELLAREQGYQVFRMLKSAA